MSVITLAAAMYGAFVKDTRTNGEEFYKLKDNSPEWMTSAIHAAHGDMLPEDWRYRTIQEACGFLADKSEDDDLDDAAQEFADDVDVYNGRLLAWVSSNLTRMAYVDEGMEELGFKDLAQALMYGQSLERREVIQALIEFLKEHAESEDDNDESDEESDSE